MPREKINIDTLKMSKLSNVIFEIENSKDLQNDLISAIVFCQYYNCKCKLILKNNEKKNIIVEIGKTTNSYKLLKRLNNLYK